MPKGPPRTARRRPWNDVAFAALDFETTGLDYARDAVISFGVVPVLGGRIVLREAVHQLVTPAVPASPASMRVHGILPKDLDGAPALAQARGALAAALERRFLLTWYAGVEVAFLARVFGTSRRTWSRRTVDVRRLVLELEGRPADTHNTLVGSATRFGVPVAAPHEALDDALVTAQLFLVVASKLEVTGRGRVRDLIALSW